MNPTRTGWLTSEGQSLAFNLLISALAQIGIHFQSSDGASELVQAIKLLVSGILGVASAWHAVSYGKQRSNVKVKLIEQPK